MGRKRNWPGKHIYICFACLIITIAAGCTTVPANNAKTDTKGRNETHWRLIAPEELNDEKALLLAATKPHGDETLFDMGIEYAGTANYSKSLTALKKLIRDYPRSPWAERAKPVVDMIQENYRLKRQNADIGQENGRLQKQASESLQESARLKQVIEQSKKIDLEIGGKKREQVR